MNVTIKEQKDNLVTFEIIISAKDADDAYNRSVVAISNHINIDGFRKGKAPKAMVEKHVGVERIKIEAVESLAPKFISQAIQENKLDVITQPSITSYTYEYGSDMSITVQVETRPEVVLGEYKNLTFLNTL